jgi:hypothetical protein
MKTKVTLAATALVLIPLTGFADDQPKLSCVKDITYSEQFLAKYPKAGAACREVVMKNGEKWARFDADVVKVQGNTVTATFKGAANESLDTLTISGASDVHVSVEGQDTKLSSLQPHQQLSFWVPQSRMAFYAAPGGSQLTVSHAPTQH